MLLNIVKSPIVPTCEVSRDLRGKGKEKEGELIWVAHSKAGIAGWDLINFKSFGSIS